MYSRSHLAVSAVLGGAVALWAGAAPGRAAIVVVYAAVLGTAIDLDHFVIARLRTGDWHNLRLAVADPRAAFVEQERLFEPGDVGVLTRLTSHALIGGFVVAVLAPVAPLFALVSAVVVYGHVLCDLAAGVWKYER